MYRILENFFRHPWRLLVILIVLPIIGVTIAYLTAPRSYESTARLWAYQRLGITTATNPNTSAYDTPAQSQVTTLTGLLHTRSFALSVAAGSGLDKTLKSQDGSNSNGNNRQYLEDAIFANIYKNVIVASQTDKLYTISYTSNNPTLAQKVVASVITQFTIEGARYTYGNAKNLLQIYQAQLNETKKEINQDLQAEHNYLKNHPEFTQSGGPDPANDPQYAALLAQQQLDEQRARTLQTNIDTINLQIGTDGSSLQNVFKEIDAPQVPYQSLSRSKQYIMGGGVALGSGMFAYAIFLLILVRRDRAIYISRDLEKLGNLPVILGIPQLPAETMKVLIERSA
jgi:uncharacterized protein involved in exopolysaccharide biosynthesis